jgi:N-carbamoylputrescine amidase
MASKVGAVSGVPFQTSGRGSIRVGLVQMAMSASRDENLATAERMIAEAAGCGAQVVCLPELFLGPYFCQAEDPAQFAAAEPFPGPLSEQMGSLAGRLGVAIVVPFFERRAPGVYHNSAFVADADGSVLGLYRKMHIPDDPAFYEKYYFAPGDLGFRAWDTAFGRVGVLICWDQWYPEAARLTALRGAEVLFYPTAIGWHPREREARGGAQFRSWQTVQRGHAVANGCFVVAVNRVGHERPPGGGDGIVFWGQSFVADPAGELLVEGPVADAAVLTADLDLGAVERQRIEWPFFRDRRIDAYGGIGERFGG